MPVANPDLAARKRARLFDRAYLKDPMGLEEPAYQLRDREKVVMPSTLDRRSRVLLLRAQEAIAISLDEEARAAEPDGVVPTVLRWHEWEIATALRDITDLRAEHELNTVASVGPMTQSVLSSQVGALARAEEAIAARVSGLERYAERVRAAAIAYRDWQDALRVSDLNDRYLDLVARTAADEHAVAEISGLTERAAAAQTFRQAVQDVSLAAAALELP
jgi:PAS domain-containing protein